MIPAAFDYHRPTTTADAVKIISEHGDEARVIAGGHSLIPMMKPVSYTHLTLPTIYSV